MHFTIIEDCIEEIKTGCTDCRKEGDDKNYYKEVIIIKHATCGGKACSPLKQPCELEVCEEMCKDEIGNDFLYLFRISPLYRI